MCRMSDGRGERERNWFSSSAQRSNAFHQVFPSFFSSFPFIFSPQHIRNIAKQITRTCWLDSIIMMTTTMDDGKSASHNTLDIDDNSISIERNCKRTFVRWKENESWKRGEKFDWSIDSLLWLRRKLKNIFFRLILKILNSNHNHWSIKSLMLKNMISKLFYALVSSSTSQDDYFTKWDDILSTLTMMMMCVVCVCGCVHLSM
jgi:hypothetical protein